MKYQNISDVELKKAAELVRTSLLEAAQPPVDQEYAFSDSFLQKVDRLKVQARRKKRNHKVFQRTVAAVLAIMISVTLLLGVNTEARAAVIAWFREVFEDHDIFWFTQKRPEKLPVFELGWIPEGHLCVYDETSDFSRAMLYLNEEIPEEGFAFGYGFAENDSPLTVRFDRDIFTTKEVTINGTLGYLYISSDEKEAHGLAWIDEDNVIAFYISSSLNPEVILTIAENIKLVK